MSMTRGMRDQGNYNSSMDFAQTYSKEVDEEVQDPEILDISNAPKKSGNGAKKAKKVLNLE